jgi:hypothetical protein
VRDEDEYGGDPPCWAHLFEEDAGEGAEDHPPAADSSSPTPDRPVTDQKGVRPADKVRGERGYSGAQ